MTGRGYEMPAGTPRSSLSTIQDLAEHEVEQDTEPCGDHSKCEFPTSKQNCLEQKDNIFTEQAPPSENACNHGFRTWLPYECVVILPALRLSWPIVTVVSEGRVPSLRRVWKWVHVGRRASFVIPRQNNGSVFFYLGVEVEEKL